MLHACVVLAQTPSEGLRFKGFSKTPQGHVQPGGWLVLRANLANSSQQTRTASVHAKITGLPEFVSSRTIDVLPDQDAQVDVAVYVPGSLSLRDKAEFELTLYEVQDGQETLLDVAGVPMRHTLTLPVERRPNLCFLAIDPEPRNLPYWTWPRREPYLNYEMVVSSRIVSGNSRITLGFEPNSLPLNFSDWQDVGLIVISDPAVFDDLAAVEALRRYVNDGGRVWVMLDRVPCRLVRPLLGNGQVCEELDEVQLTSFAVSVASKIMDLSDKDLQIETDQPVRLKRVMQTGGEVSHEVEGWPAAIWMQVGYGELLLTTLSSGGWIMPGSESTVDPQLGTEYKTRAWAFTLASEAHEIRHYKPLTAKVDYPLQFIGNPVLPRSLVGSLLLAFVLLLAGVAVALWRFGEVSRIGLVAPVLSVACGGLLFASSSWIRRDIPETVAKLQVVQVTEDGSTAAIREQAAMHVASERAMALVSQVDGLAVADASVQSGIKRFTRGDFQQWELSNLAWPLGTWRYSADYATGTEACIAEGRLTSGGLELRVPSGLPSDLSDPVISFVPGVPMIGTARDQTILADGGLIADGERWIRGTIISDEQRRRMEVYREFFRADEQTPLPRRTLFGWTKPWPTAEWGIDLLQSGSALVGLPIHLQRPPLGSQVLLPSGLIQLRKNPAYRSQTAALSSATGKWTAGMAMGVESNLQFVLPPEVVPFAAQSLDLALDMKAPHRTVRLVAQVPDAEPIEIVRLDGPSVPWQSTVTDPRILQAARDGTVDVGLVIGDRNDLQEGESSTTVVTWQIDSFRASLRGSRMSE